MLTRWSALLVLVIGGCGEQFSAGDPESTQGGADTGGGGSTTSQGAGGAGAMASSGGGAGGTSSGGGDGGTSSGGGDGGTGGCPELPCKLTVPQCGCPPTLQCTVDGSWNRICATEPVSPKQEGEACTGGDCVVGTACFRAWNSAYSCAAFCNSNADCTLDPRSKCLWKDNLGVSTVCTSGCDPITSNGCVAGDKCRPVWDSDDSSNVGTTCAYADAKAKGDACSSGGHCAPGLACANSACRTQCVVGGSDCEASEYCANWSPPANTGTVVYGVCLPV